MEAQILLNNSASVNKTADQQLKIKKSSMALFNDRSTYINCSRMYYAYFEAIPSLKMLKQIDYRKTIKWVEQEFSDGIVKKHYRQNFNKRSGKMEYVDVIYILRNGLLVDVDSDGTVALLFTSESEEQAHALSEKIKMFIPKKNPFHDISLLMERGIDMHLVDLKIAKPKLQLEVNYNDDLVVLHKSILGNLKKNDKSGLMLFHGLPGTGKSTYIRYLVHCLTKKIIFLSPRVAGNLDSIAMTNVLMDNRNSIIVIEDAEELLKSREAGNNSSISMLLNLSSGMLGEGLGIQFICTFNMELTNIDEALLRKGRLTALYEFKPLAGEKAKVLLQKLGVNEHPVSGAMTLADIYNIKEQGFALQTKRSPIGFAIQAA